MPEPQIFNDPWFRLMCAVGFALYPFREPIFVQTDEEEGRDWLSVIGLLESVCFSAAEQGRSDDPDYLIDRAREDFETVANRFDEENTGLRKTLSSFVKSLRNFDEKAILASFDGLNRNSLALTQTCTREWGGSHSCSRASKLKPWKLAFDDPKEALDGTPVCTWTDTSEKTIHLVIGSGQKPLINFLSLEFYLLHEYLSHVFPTWEDGAGKLSEGYLFPVARWWYTKQARQMESAIVAADWKQHWERLKLDKGAEYWSEFHRRSDWLDVHSSKPWVSLLLLELAGFDNHRDSLFQPKVLRMLSTVYRHNLGAEIDSVHRLAPPIIEKMYKELYDRLKHRIPHKLLKRLTI